MSSTLRIKLGVLVLGLAASAMVQANEHPRLVMTQAGVERIRAELGKVPLFDATVAEVRAEVDAEIELGIDTPIPEDYSGGYTHERHKRNFLVIQKAGALYQVLDDEKYANYVRDMLFQYEAMYKNLPLHPKTRSYARGKLFWQCLNDANWLVYVSQAYDAIYDYLSAEERSRLEKNLFRPFADHISVDSPQFFNRVHNHSTWGNAAVGMIGLVMGDDELVERALYGIPFDEIDADARDDDGGFIYSRDRKAGFLANLEEPFSPDGYYTEGPYYQRYAMYPFLVFAQGLHNAKPELAIFEKDGEVLLKAVNALLNLSDADGEFFPLNDAQKGMSYQAESMVTAVDIAYHAGGGDPRLLSVAEEQGRVLLDDAGFNVAAAVRDGKAKPFQKKSVNLADGPDGKQGGVAVLRPGDNNLELVFKYSSQGLSHGHYDKLSFSLYEDGDEVLQDYGMARFVNIEQKGGGNYLKENTTWAKQTVAHNTLVQNETSHFGGKYEVGSLHHSDLYFFDDARPDVQVVSATESNAYPGTQMMRTLAIITNRNFEKPFVLDIFNVVSDAENQYDLPFHFMGHVMQANFEYESPALLEPLGKANGYQHLFVEGLGRPATDNAKLSWMVHNRFYTLTSGTQASDELLFTRLGANDPEFNLRRDAGFMIRRKGAGNTVFISVVESHGGYNPVSELAVNANSSISSIEVLHNDARYTVVSIVDVQGSTLLFFLARTDASASSRHEVQIAGQAYEWTGPYNTVEQSPWLRVEDFESDDALQRWTNIDVQNETDPHVPHPQVTVIRSEPGTGNRYMLRKPAAEGVVGNRKAIGFMPLPKTVGIGETWTFHTRVNVESFPNNHSFGLSNVPASDIPRHGYDAFEPMIRITDKHESDGFKNDGTLMVLSGDKAYSKIINPATGQPAKPLEPGRWYELWYVVNNAAREAGGQRYDLYVRGGEFTMQTLVFEGAEFRMQRSLPLSLFMAISNTGPHKGPYGNGGVRYDDIYMARGRMLSSPLE
jgi:hypothetical protein